MSRPTWTLILVMTAAPLAACSLTRPTPADIRVPPDVLRGAPYTAGGEPPRTRYVVRMTDGQRDWEIQLPEMATAYEVKVPLGGKPAAPMSVDLATPTAADREIIEQRASADRAEARADGAGVDEDEGDAAAGAAGPRGKPPRRAMPAKGAEGGRAKGSYLLTLARVKDLYRARHYELALVEIVELEKQYPNDERILSMKGSLYERLGNANLARESWQQVLALNPFNLAVLEALQRLGK